MSRLKAARRRPAQNFMELGGISFDAETVGALLYGISDGMQYKGMESAALKMANVGSNLVESNCFYALYGMVDSWDTLVFDFNHFISPEGEVKWFNLVGYNPTHIMNNFAVSYE